MSEGLNTVTVDRARSSILQALGIAPSSDVALPAVCAEAVRAALWAIWSVDRRPVYTTRLLNAAKRMLLPWQPATGEMSLEEMLKNTLQELELIDDLAPMPGGYWSPTPLRVVHLERIQRWLLLGGYPSRLLSQAAKDATERAGVARLLRCTPAGAGLDASEIPEREWRRIPGEDLAAWAKTVLEQSPLTPAGNLQADIYAPGMARAGAFQFDRWRSSPQGLPDGRYLARTVSRYGIHTYYIVELQHERIIAAGQPFLGDGDIRRLQCALDRLAGNPTSVQVKRQSDCWTFELQSALPRAEHQLLLTIGRETTPKSGKYYPRWWVVPANYAQQADQALRDLGIVVKYLD
ncbi:MAG: hypothetical protein RMJ55_07105 [Roseiflexaceae bacterium]|nr:hypothetical protein [Roseiflexus sp.]MDW8213306.1 hypothetical protein [Roseiflexaceae bacterium]